MTIFIGADHRGFELKESLKSLLIRDGVTVVDCGASGFEPQDDFVDYAAEVARQVVNKNARGILICGSGVGMAIAANKIAGARASLGMTEQQVRAGRNDDDMNMLVLAADYLSEPEAETLARVFIDTPFAQDERFIRRLNKIKELETHYE